MPDKYVFAFEEGRKEQKFLLGGKGANLAEMTNLGLPVPPGFTITTEACNAYMAGGDTLPPGLMDEVSAARHALEAKMGKQLGACRAAATSSIKPGGRALPPAMYALQASVVIVKPGGVGSPAIVISARPAPFPPRRSFIPPLPSAVPSPQA